jgi:hypothetical protein
LLIIAGYNHQWVHLKPVLTIPATITERKGAHSHMFKL